MSFRFVPFPLCPSNSGFLCSLCFLPSLCRILGIQSCLRPRYILLFPPCLHWIVPSQLSDCTVSIIFQEALFLTTSHTRLNTPPIPHHPHFSQRCHSSHSTLSLFSGFHSQLQFYICSCHYSIHASVSSSDCRLWGAGNKSVSAPPWYPACLVQGLAIVDSVYICGIVRHMGHMAKWMDGFPLLLSYYRLNPNG